MVKFQRYSHEKYVFCSIPCKNGYFPASDLFHMFTQSIKFYTSHNHALRWQMFEKCDSSIGSQKKNGCSFQQVLQQTLGCFFVLTLENAFSKSIHFKGNIKSIRSSKKCNSNYVLVEGLSLLKIQVTSISFFSLGFLF